MRLTPSPKLPLFLTLVVFCGLLADLGLTGYWLCGSALLIVLGLALADLLRLIRCAPAIRVQRQIRKSLPLGVWSRFRLELAHAGSERLHIQVAERLPAGMAGEPESVTLLLDSGRKAEILCRIRPSSRGSFVLPGPDLLLTSPWGFWRHSRLLPCPDTVRVLPNFRELHRYTLLADTARLNRMGIRKLASQGEGQEFQQLREYRPGDALRQIDWKATSRMQQLIARDYQEESDQHIVLVLDCSRRMRHVNAGLSLFDQALNSALLLAHVATRQGDSVGLLAFGEKAVWHPPGKKAGIVRSLLLASTQLFPESVAMDYRELARDLEARLKRRSLILVLTNSRAEDYEELAVLARQLGRRHLLVIADLLEQEAADTLAAEPHTTDESLRWQSLLAYQRERRHFGLRLRRLGCLALDCTAPELPPALVNTYLAIKQQKRL